MTERRRDRLGRPLAANAPTGADGPPVPDTADLTDAQVWASACRLLDSDLPFHAHEVFEQRWRRAAPADRTAWRALAQWGAALTHAARGNDAGAHRLAERALATLAAAEAIPSAVDVEHVRRSCTALLRG